MGPAPRSHAGSATSTREPPLRMAFLYVPNGVHMPDWTPRSVGAEFRAAGDPRAAVARSRTTSLILSGLTLNPARALGDGGGDHARAMASFLTGRHPRKTDGADLRAGISVDQAGRPIHRPVDPLPLAGDRLRGGQERAASATTAIAVPISRTSPGRASRLRSPKRSIPGWSFDRLFGEPAPTADGGDASRADRQHKSVLDFVGEDARQLRASAGGGRPPQARRISHRRSRDRAADRRAAGPTIDLGGTKYPRPLGIPADYQEHLRLMADLLVLAFQSDLTRVATFVFANDGSNRSYREHRRARRPPRPLAPRRRRGQAATRSRRSTSSMSPSSPTSSRS